MFGQRMMGVAEHYVGDQMSARRHLEQVLAQDAVSDHGRDASRFQDVVRFGTDLRVSTQVFLARVLWLQGFADQAVRMLAKSLGEAEATGYAITQCYVIALAACPIAFWVGDQTAAARYTATLVICRDSTPCRIGLLSAPGLNKFSSSKLAVSMAVLGGGPAARRKGLIPTSAFAP